MHALERLRVLDLSHVIAGPTCGHYLAKLGAHDSGFRVGQTVHNARFGSGGFLGLEGSGTDARAKIQFKRDGMRWLAISVAKLEPA
jgi:DNA helicase-2/ATP-dependent DNA helicase PcrA